MVHIAIEPCVFWTDANKDNRDREESYIWLQTEGQDFWQELEPGYTVEVRCAPRYSLCYVCCLEPHATLTRTTCVFKRIKGRP